MGMYQNILFVLAGVLFVTVCSSTKIHPALVKAEQVVHNDKLLAVAFGNKAVDGETKTQPVPYESPNLYQDPRMGTWYINQTAICIILEMGMRFHFNYEKRLEEGEDDTEMAHVAVEIPTDAPADGDCQTDNHHIKIMPFPDWEYQIYIADLGEHYSATHVTIKYVLDETRFPGAVDQGANRTATLMGSSEDEEEYFFKTEKGTAFTCRKNVQLAGFEEEDLELERLESANFRMECFREDTDIEISGDTTICKADEIDMLPPIIIGVVVGCTMLIVVIIYALMRMRRNPVYEATPAEGLETDEDDNDKSEADEMGEDNSVKSSEIDLEKGAENNISS